MNKSELTELIAEKADLSKASAGRAIDALIEAVTQTVAAGGTVSLVGFGTFESRKRAARTGKNPQTGAALKIPASTVPAFKPGKGFKDAVNTKAGKKK